MEMCALRVAHQKKGDSAPLANEVEYELREYKRSVINLQNLSFS